MLAATAAAALMLCYGAGASAVTVVQGGYSLSDTSFGTGFGVHSDGTQLNVNTINAHVNQEGSAVTFTSGELLSDNGGGEAQINGSFNDLTVNFAHGWGRITFAFSLPNGPGSPGSSAMTLAVNGTPLFNTGNCSICTLGANGEQKFTIEGPSITQLSFTYDPSIATAKQFRVEAPIPEPASWAMMLLGFFGCGSLLRSRRKDLGLAT
jgi:hypothetical protein